MSWYGRLSHKLIVSASTLAWLWLGALPAFCLSANDVESMINKEEIFDKGTKLIPFLAGDEAVVRVRLPAVAETDTKDYKINAALVAKSIITADKTVKKVVVRFYNGETTESYKEVAVTSVDIKAYGSGIVSKDDLLSSLELKDGNERGGTVPAAGATASATTAPKPQDGQVAAGPLQTERRALLGRIQILKSQGVGVKPFMERFNEIEQAAQKGDSTQLSDNVEELSDSVSTQEKTLNERTKAEQARIAKEKADKEKADLQKRYESSQKQLAATRAYAEQQQAAAAPHSSGFTEMFKLFAPKQWTKFVIDMGNPLLCRERAYVATVLSGRTVMGQSTDQFLPLFQQMEDAASQNRAEDVRRIYDELCRQLNVTNDPNVGMEQLQTLRSKMEQEHREHPGEWHHHHHQDGDSNAHP